MERSQFSKLRKLPLLAAMLLWAFALIAALPHSASANSVSTTNVDDSVVNKNLYDAKGDVYISGKPTTCGGEGLAPDGTYYFQVTDPSGATLLSSDPLDCRIITVTNGVITAYGPAALGCTAHSTGTPALDCLDGKVTVQLAPFDDTPNNGGVYKVWVEPTSVTLPAGCDATADETNHDAWSACGAFDNSSSKTDNFRVAGETPPNLESVINVLKFCDVNGNGTLDPDEFTFGLPGWQMNFSPDPASCSGLTGVGGVLSCGPFTPPVDPTTYTVSEDLLAGYTHTATCVDGVCGAGHCSITTATACTANSDCPQTPLPAETCVASMDVSASSVHQVDIGNVGGITGRKFSDLNANGVDDSEPGVQGVQFLLTGTALDGVTPISLCTNSGADGTYSFPLTPGTNLTVTEQHPPGTIATTPLTCPSSPGSFGDPTNPASCKGFNCSFGNACLGGSCAAKTLGWWKNSGNSSITGADLCALTALNLRDAKGNNFDPIAAATCAANGNPTGTTLTNGRKALATWLGNATATNMAYMLSAQFATMTLNTRHPSANCNLAGVSLYVGTPPTTTPKCLGKGTLTPLVNASGFITLSALMTDINAELYSYPITTSGKTDAVCQGFKEVAIDKANNSETVGAPGIINVACPAVNNPCPTPPSP